MAVTKKSIATSARKSAAAKKVLSLISVIVICFFAVGISASIAGNDVGSVVLVLSIAFIGYVAFKRRAEKSDKRAEAKTNTQVNKGVNTIITGDTKEHAPLATRVENVPQYSADGNLIVNGMEIVDVHVAGVTFRNGRRTRQAILRAIKWGDPPYDEGVVVTVKKTEFEGSDAFEVWANEEMIGYVPKIQVPFFSKNWHRYSRSTRIKVNGGGTTEEGEQISYGAVFSTYFGISVI